MKFGKLSYLDSQENKQKYLVPTMDKIVVFIKFISIKNLNNNLIKRSL